MKLSFLEACEHFLELVKNMPFYRQNCSWHFGLKDFNETLFLEAAHGISRFVYVSRDNNIELWGLGVAHIIKNQHVLSNGAFDFIRDLGEANDDEQYFLANRFDECSNRGEEWRHFYNEQFILPLILVKKTSHNISIYLYYRLEMPLVLWQDRVITLLKILLEAYKSINIKFCIKWSFNRSIFFPEQKSYMNILNRALKSFNNDHYKVVIGRRRTLFLEYHHDPALLFIKLKNNSSASHCYFLDMGQGSAFFGASPELVYRRKGSIIETESLAGTRARSNDKDEDKNLRHDLLIHAKDAHEHEIVSSYLLNALQKFPLKNIRVSDLSVVSLTYVHHLIKRLKASINHNINDEEIIRAIHPTPASCGCERTWALNFIRSHEGFDRGLYSGLVGYINKNDIEVALAIRSALLVDKCLHVYAASGIVSGSNNEDEWSELDAKERNILQLFE